MMNEEYCLSIYCLASKSKGSRNYRQIWEIDIAKDPLSIQSVPPYISTKFEENLKNNFLQLKTHHLGTMVEYPPPPHHKNL